MREYRRRLPHRDAPGMPTFVTWRLHDSLPVERTFHPEHLKSGKAFVAWDRMLDTATTGPMFLRIPEIARLVKEQLQSAVDGGLCDVHAYAIMPNHVHVLWTPARSLAQLVHGVKGATAFRANKILNRTGPFWQQEYFDRMVRNRGEFDRIWAYIEQNPVNAGLVRCPEEFLWSSAWRG